MAKNKDNRNWFSNHKILTVLVAIVLIVALIAAFSGNKDLGNGVDGKASNNSNNKTYRFNDRADKQKEDVEALPGETATVDGVKMTLSNVEYKQNLGEFDSADNGKTYVIADVALENTSNETRSYNVFDFRIQTAGGQVLDGAFTTIQTLGSGDIVTGGKASGKIVFEVPIEDGHQYVIWKPDAYDAARAIVQVN